MNTPWFLHFKFMFSPAILLILRLFPVNFYFPTLRVFSYKQIYFSHWLCTFLYFITFELRMIWNFVHYALSATTTVLSAISENAATAEQWESTKLKSSAHIGIYSRKTELIKCEESQVHAAPVSQKPISCRYSSEQTHDLRIESQLARIIRVPPGILYAWVKISPRTQRMHSGHRQCVILFFFSPSPGRNLRSCLKESRKWLYYFIYFPKYPVSLHSFSPFVFTLFKFFSTFEYDRFYSHRACFRMYPQCGPVMCA